MEINLIISLKRIKKMNLAFGSVFISSTLFGEIKYYHVYEKDHAGFYLTLLHL